MRGQNTQCEYRSAHDIWLWPLKVIKAHVFAHAPDLPLAKLPVARQVRAGLRLRLRAEGGLRFNQLPIEYLQLHIAAPGNAGWRLHELIGSAALGTLVWPVEAGGSRIDVAPQWRDAGVSIASAGYEEDQALLPATMRAFSAYRLLQELAALPQRFLYFDLGQLAPRLALISATEVDIVIPFSRAEPTLEALVDEASLSLFCTPAINLFHKSLDRIHVTEGLHEFHAVPDRARPMDFEVHSIESISGHGTAQTGATKFMPLYASHHVESSAQQRYFTLRRAQRLMSQRQTLQGTRSSYMGSEVFLSLVDPGGAPYSDELRQLSVSALATNRDLPTLLPGTPNGEINQGNLSWIVDGVPAVESVECLRGPTRPLARSAQGDHGWALVNHLASNQLAIADEDPLLAAAALRAVMRLYGPEQDAGWRSQVEGIVALRASQVTRRLPHRGPLAYGLGTQVEIEVDEFAYQGASAFVTASVLERFFAQQASINSFTETTLRSPTRGVVCAWPARIGTGSRLSP